MSVAEQYRRDFPILQENDYIYFDNAATTQRPIQVMDAMKDFYENANANPLRGLYDWSVDATKRYEDARHGTNEESEESVDHLCEKCDDYAKEWAPVADEIWKSETHKKPKYENYIKEKREDNTLAAFEKTTEASGKEQDAVNQ